MPAITPVDAVFVEPSGGRWRSFQATPAAGRIDGLELAQWRSRTRRELGLPVDRTIVASGHQPVPRHPGVFAKYLALRHIAAMTDAASFDLVIDSHRGAAGAVEIPVVAGDGMLSAQTLEFASPVPGVPLCWQPPATLASTLQPAGATTASVRAGTRRIADAVDAATGETLALQLHDVERRLAARFDAAPPPVTATALLNTQFGAALVSAMVTDPRACIDAYDAAALAFPDAGVRPLRAAGADELPLWIEQDGGQARAATVDDLAGADDLRPGGLRLLPRALLTTALVRLAACDLFIHGTGGAAYDAVMEAWLQRWLDVVPAPRCTVTATVRLPLLPAGWAARRRSEVIDLARHRWHDPDAYGVSDAAGSLATSAVTDANGADATTTACSAAASADGRPPSAVKLAALAAIASSPRRSSQRFEAFRGMHAHQTLARESGAIKAAPSPAITQAITAADQLAQRRTWSHALHTDAALAQLRTSIAAELLPAPAALLTEPA